MGDEIESMVKVTVKFSGNWDNRDYHSGMALSMPNRERPYRSVQLGMEQRIIAKYGDLLNEDPFHHNRSSTIVNFFGREYMTAADRRLLQECLKELKAFGSVQARNVQDGRVKRTGPCKPLEIRLIEADEGV